MITEVSSSIMRKWCSAIDKTSILTTKSSVAKNFETTGLKYVPMLESDVATFTTKTAKQILKEFKPAETIEEATKRGVEEYGLKAFKFTDIDVANDALYVLHKIKSKISVPLGITEIIEVPTLGFKGMSCIAADINPTTGVMRIAKTGLVRSCAARVGTMAQQVPMNKLIEYEDLMIKMHSGKIPMFKLTQDMEKMGLKASKLHDLPFQTLIHEQGHRAHFLSVGKEELFCKMLKLEEIKDCGITDFSIFEEFMSKEIQDIISSWEFLGSYAKTSPCEFVAEVYSALIHDIKVPDNIMKLYNKYNGPMVLGYA